MITPVKYTAFDDFYRKFFKFFYLICLFAPFIFPLVTFFEALSMNTSRNFVVSINLTIAWLIFSIFCLTLGYNLRRLSYKIVLNLKDREISFYMLTKNEIVTVNFNDIIKVKVAEYLHFYLKEKKIVFNCRTKANKKNILNGLKEYFTIEIGILGDLSKVWKKHNK